MAVGLTGKNILNIIPTVRAERICIMKRKKPIFDDLKTPAPIPPIMNAGPVLLQKARARSASSFEQHFSENRVAIVAAPIGYPPQKPIIRAEERFLFTEKSAGIIFLNTRQNKSDIRSDVNSLDKTKKGKRDGITDFPQRISEFWAASEVFSGKRIRPNVKKKTKTTTKM